MGNDQKVHFKMYKSGKTWLVAGVIALAWPVVGLTGHAATAASKPDTTQAAKVASRQVTAEKVVTLQGVGSQAPAKAASPKVTVPSDVKPEATTADKPVVKVASKESEQPTAPLATPKAQPQDQLSDSQPIASKSDDSVSKTSESKPVLPAAPIKSTVPAELDTSKVTVTPKPDTPAPTAPVVKTPETQPDAVVTPEKVAPKTPVSTSEVPATKPAPRAVTTKSEQPDVDPNQADQQVRTAVDYLAYHQTDNVDNGQFGTSEYWIDANNVLHIGAGQLDNTGVYAVDDPDYPNQANQWGYQIRDVTKIKFEGKVVANADASGLFMDMGSLESIDGLDQLDTSQVTNMAYMFANDTSLQMLDLAGKDTSKVTNMASMFAGDSSLKTLNLTGMNTSKVTDMRNTFYGLDTLKSLDLSSFDTGQVTSMAGMLGSDSDLINLNISSLNTSKVTDMSGMFALDHNIVTLDLSNFNTSKVTTMASMFQEMSALKDLNISRFDTSQVQDMSYMFSKMPALRDLNLVNFDTSRVQDMSSMFDGAGSNTMITINLASFDMKNVDQLPYMLNATPLRITLGANTVLSLDGYYPVNGYHSAYEKYLANEYYDLDDSNSKRPQPSGLQSFSPKVPHDGDWYTGKWFDVKDHKIYTTDQLIALYATIGHNPTATYQQQTNLEVQDSVIHLGENWQAGDNFVSATDKDGSDVKVDNPMITIKRQPDTQQLGKQIVVYTFVNTDGNVATRQAQVLVTGIALHDSSKRISTTTAWSPRDNVKLAVDAQGNLVDASAIVMTIVNSQGQTVTNFQTPGSYLIHYQIGDDLASRVTIPLTVYSLAALTGKNSAINLGATWHPSDNFSAVDENGHPLTVTSPGVSVKGQPNINVPGNYQVTYNYVDASGYAVSQVLTVTVAGIQLKQQNVEATTTDHWQPATNLQRAVNAEGKSLSAADLQIVTTALAQGRTAGNALLTVPGTYLVTYRFDDRLGTHQVQTQVKIISKASVVAHDQKIQVGATWQPQAGFVSATDEHGRTLSWDKIKVTGDVDTHRAGRYLVQYLYTDAAGNQTSQTTVVTVFDPNTGGDLGGGDHNIDGGNGNQGGNNSGGDHNLGSGNSNQGEPDGNQDWNGGYRPQQPDLNQNDNQLTTPVLTRPKPSQPTLASKPASLPQTSETDSHEVGALIGLTGLVVSGYLALVGRLKRY